MWWKGIIFDLWETIILETPELSQEWHDRRVKRLTRIIQGLKPIFSFNEIQTSYYAVQNDFRKKQRFNQVVTPPEKQIEFILERLGLVGSQFPREICDQLLQDYISVALDPLPLLAPSAKYILRILCSQEYEIGLVSNTASTPGSVMREILNRLDIRQFFSFMLFSDEVGYPKPHRAIFKEIFNYLADCKPEELVFIGNDYRADICGAKEAGITTVWLCNNRVDSPKDFRPNILCHDHEIEPLSSLLSVLQNLRF